MMKNEHIITENKTKKKKIDMLFDAYVLFHVHVLQ